MRNIGTTTRATMGWARRLLPAHLPFIHRPSPLTALPSPFAIPLLLLLASCATTPSSSQVSQVHLFGLPIAIDLDQRPGPDGISIRVFASKPEMARGLPIRSGTLEVLAFDGPVPPGKPLPAQPMATWSFNPDQLKPMASTSSLGTGYQLTLAWPGQPPTKTHVTVLARYSAPHLPKPVLSGSATIALRPR